MKGRRMIEQAGTTLAEVLIGTAILSVVTGGTLTAYVTAARLQHLQSGPQTLEAAGYAQDWLEALRNRVAADDPFFQDRAGDGWIDDDPSTNLPPKVPSDPEVVRRVYRVDPADCDGDLVTGDCHAVTVKVCWNQAACP